MASTRRFLLFVLAWFVPAFAGAASPPQQSITVERIFEPPGLFDTPPEEMVWSPDSKRLIYIGSAGNLMVIDAENSAQKVLVERTKMRSLSAPSSIYGERRLRYQQQSCFWAPDSKHLLFDSSGQFWFFDPDTGTGLELASTGDGSWGNPQFSPNGAYFSYIRGHNLYARSMQQSDVAIKLTDSPSDPILNGDVDWVYEEELDVRSNYFWSPDSKRVAYLRMDETQVPGYPIEDWLPDHGKVEREPYPQPGDPSPVVRVGVVGANGGKTKWIRIPLEKGKDYIPRFGWINGKTLWIETLSRDQKTRTVYFADVTNNDVRPVLAQKDEKYLSDSYTVAVAAQNILVISWQDGHNHIYLYRFDPAKPLAKEATFIKQLTGGDWDVSKIAAVDLAAQRVYYLSNEGDPRQQQIWSVGLDGAEKRRISSSGAWHDPVFSPNAQFYADMVSSAATPPVAELCRRETQCTAFWKSSPLGVKVLNPIDLKLKASDGTTTLYGRLLLPQRHTGVRSIPLILNPYGGPLAQMVTEQWRGNAMLFDQVLAEHGIAVMQVDNRGMGGRGRDFAQAAFDDFGAVQFSDQLAALDQVLDKYPQLDPTRLGWWGWSWGGSFTLYAMTHSSRFRVGVSIAPVTDWHNYDSIYTERYLGTPAEDPDGYAQSSVVESAKNLKGSLLLVQGTADENVHFGNTIQFIQQLIDAGIPYDLQIYPGTAHSLSGPERSIYLYNRILRHFESCLLSLCGANGSGGQTQ